MVGNTVENSGNFSLIWMQKLSPERQNLNLCSNKIFVFQLTWV